VVTIPTDVAWYWAQHKYLNPELISLAGAFVNGYRQAEQLPGRNGEFSLLVESSVLPIFVQFLEEYVVDHAEASADGQVVYSVPQMWYRDP